MSQAQHAGIFSEMLDAFDAFNKMFARTLGTILVRPNIVIDNIQLPQGPKHFVSPYRFAFLTFSFFVIVSTFLELNFSSLFADLKESSGNTEIEAWETTLWQFLDASTVFFMFVTLIPTAWLLSLMFKSSGRDMAACYKICLYAYSVTTLMMLVVVTPIKFIFPDLSATSNLYFIQSVSALTTIYLIWIHIKCFSVGIWEGIWKTIVSVLWYQLMAIIVVGIITFFLGVYAGYSEAHAESQETTLRLIDTDSLAS